jgi:DNA-binding phage protein
MRAYRATPPTITQIASRTGLSRQTVYNHMREFATDPAFKGKTNMFDLMKHDVMMRLASSAIGGDMQAIRLYLQLTGMLDKRKEKK